jgi:pyruvate/2-oxoglutarate dehydrogenase complex dihydrolipoamide acyltransferase (E2) component
MREKTSGVVVPRINVNDDQAVISAWLVPVGEHVAEGQVIATLETTKVSFDVSAEREGYVGYDLKVKSVVAVGDMFAWISDVRGERPKGPGAAAAASTSNSEAEVSARITRKALRRMRELGVTEAELAGLEHVQAADVERVAAARQAARAVAKSEPAPAGEASVPLEQSPTKMIEAARLAETYRSIVPSMVTLPVACAKVGARLNAFVGEIGPVSLLELVIHEVAAELRDFPDLNGFFHAGQASTYRDIGVGFALNAGRSLRVPVLHGADTLSQLEVCRRVRELMLRYFRDELSMEDLGGGTFTITDLSAQGVTHFVPVLNDRQSAILGVCAPDPQQQFQNLVLAFDHRMSDGMRGGTFLSNLRERLEG